MGTSPVTRQTVSKEAIPWWTMLAVVADLTETMCQVNKNFPRCVVSLRSISALASSVHLMERRLPSIHRSFSSSWSRARPVVSSVPSHMDFIEHELKHRARRLRCTYVLASESARSCTHLSTRRARCSTSLRRRMSSRRSFEIFANGRVNTTASTSGVADQAGGMGGLSRFVHSRRGILQNRDVVFSKRFAFGARVSVKHRSRSSTTRRSTYPRSGALSYNRAV